MIESRRVLGLITARGGSKGVPRKNVRPLQGKPLIAWTIDAALNAPVLDRLILSSDDPEIIDVARRHGCDVPFVRPAALACDTANSIDVVRHALSSLPESYDYVVLLQPTSPLRVASDIENCVRLCNTHDVSSCVSVSEVEKTPYWMFKLDGGQRLVPLLPSEQIPQSRQEAPKVYALNGAVFVARTEHITTHDSFISSDTLAYVMEKDRSVDIDAEEDFVLLEFRMANRNG